MQIQEENSINPIFSIIATTGCTCGLKEGVCERKAVILVLRQLPQCPTITFAMMTLKQILFSIVTLTILFTLHCYPMHLFAGFVAHPVKRGARQRTGSWGLWGTNGLL